MVAGEHDIKPTCLSDRCHDSAIQNHVLHYLGCIEICERPRFYEVNEKLCRIELQNEYRRLIREFKGEQAYKSWIESRQTDEEVLGKAAESVKIKLKQWKEACNTETRRIDYLRALLIKDKDDQQLIWDLEASRTKWRASAQYKEGLPAVQMWREGLPKPPSDEDIFMKIPEGQPITIHGLASFSVSQQRWQPTSFRHHPESSTSGGPARKADYAPSIISEGEMSRPSMDLPHENPAENPTESPAEYNPEKDFNLHIIEYEDVESREGVEGNSPIRIKRQLPELKVKINMILGKSGPKQGREENPLYRTKEPGRLRYVHLPANNMIWAEEAIARYYGEERPEYDGIYRDLKGIDKTQTYMILRPQFWRGQLHGGRSAPPHARHMRPLCDTVSSNPKRVDRSPRNIVLFMPYLHWETDRQRDIFALNIENITENWKKEKKRKEEQNIRERQEKRKGLPKVKFKPWPKEEEEKNTWSTVWTYLARKLFPSKPFEGISIRKTKNAPLEPNQSAVNGTSLEERKVNIDAADHGRPQNHRGNWFFGWFRHSHRHIREIPLPDARIRSFPTLVKALGYGNKKGLPVKNGRVITPSPLGQYIIDAARLYEEMSNFRDKKLLQKYLHNELPLHPRRTLDQSYYWTLDKTDNRDRDQVVYRGTKPGSFHEYDPKTGLWPEHAEQGMAPDKGCDECRVNIRKVSRIIMVDQLWMWILDEQTIITCFPKRYGSNKQENDASSVHKSIRIRLHNARQNHIRSVFDLALVIIDECSNTFFDRTKTRDRQPQVMDAFSEAIGNVTNKQTAAFERLYRWTKSASKVYRSKGKVDPESISELHVPLLDIYPEGILQREIKDIIEELDIMIDIHRTQRQVLRDFVMHVEHILDPLGIYGFRSQRRKNRAMFNHNGDSFSASDDKGKGVDDKGKGIDDTGKGVDDKGKGVDVNGRGISEGVEKDDKHQVYDWFKVNADELLAKVSKRVEELELLKRAAQSTSTSLTDLLALKQQQASVVQAWQSVRQSEEAVSQGRSIMMFTVVTIFFLPLSFMASVFGMNAVDFGQGNVALVDEFKYMFPISFCMIIPIFIVAFSTWTRAVIWFVYKYTVTFVLVKTGLYENWVNMGLPSRTIIENAARETEKLKNGVRGHLCQLRREQRKKEDEDWEKSHGIEPPISSQNNIQSAMTGNKATRRPWHNRVRDRPDEITGPKEYV